VRESSSKKANLKHHLLRLHRYARARLTRLSQQNRVRSLLTEHFISRQIDTFFPASTVFSIEVEGGPSSGFSPPVKLSLLGEDLEDDFCIGYNQKESEGWKCLNDVKKQKSRHGNLGVLFSLSSLRLTSDLFQVRRYTQQRPHTSRPLQCSLGHLLQDPHRATTGYGLLAWCWLVRWQS